MQGVIFREKSLKNSRKIRCWFTLLFSVENSKKVQR